MDTTTFPIRRVVVGVTIGSLSVASLMGIAALLGAGEFGDGQARVLLTTLAVGLSSIAVLCHLSVADGRYAALGVVGGLATLGALVISLQLIWSDIDGDGPWQVFGISTVLAATLAQACLLVSVNRTDEAIRPLPAVTLGLAAVLAGLLSLLILGADEDGLWRIIGVVAILDVLGTLVTMALGVVRRVSTPAPAAQRPGQRVVVLPPSVAAQLEHQARVTGRFYDDLLVDAVVDYLATHSR